MKNYFYQYADSYVNTLQETPYDMKKYFAQLLVTSQMMDEFRKSVISTGFDFPANEMHENSEHISFALKREILARIWGEEGRYIANALVDKQLAQCLPCFRQCEEM